MFLLKTYQNKAVRLTKPDPEPSCYYWSVIWNDKWPISANITQAHFLVRTQRPTTLLRLRLYSSKRSWWNIKNVGIKKSLHVVAFHWVLIWNLKISNKQRVKEGKADVLAEFIHHLTNSRSFLLCPIAKYNPSKLCEVILIKSRRNGGYSKILNNVDENMEGINAR